jgi:hypothetical protein
MLLQEAPAHQAMPATASDKYTRGCGVRYSCQLSHYSWLLLTSMRALQTSYTLQLAVI